MTDVCLQVSVGGRCHLEIFGTNAAIEPLALQPFQCSGERTLHTHPSFAQVECLAATHLDWQHIHGRAADELGHKQV